MKVKIDEILEEGLTLSEALDPVALNLQTSELQFAIPLKVAATFHKERDTVTVHVEAVGTQAIVCGRCLSVCSKSYGERFDLGYSVKDKVVLDVTSDVRQEILLSYPPKLLCREDCRGLCPRCGINLNEGDCTCKR